MFENAEDMANRIDADDLDVTADDILVLKNIGPKGAPGCRRRVISRSRRNSRARASRTSCGSRMPHERHGVRDHRVARDARGPRSAVRSRMCATATGSGLSVAKREVSLLVTDEELAQRARDNPVTEPRAGARLPQAVPRDGHAGRPGRRLRLPARRDFQRLDAEDGLTGTLSVRNPLEAFHQRREQLGAGRQRLTESAWIGWRTCSELAVATARFDRWNSRQAGSHSRPQCARISRTARADRRPCLRSGPRAARRPAGRNASGPSVGHSPRSSGPARRGRS